MGQLMAAPQSPAHHSRDAAISHPNEGIGPLALRHAGRLIAYESGVGPNTTDPVGGSAYIEALKRIDRTRRTRITKKNTWSVSTLWAVR